MKWTIPELRKLRISSNWFAYEADMNGFLREGDGIVSVSPVAISGAFRIEREPERFVFAVNIRCTLVMPCAITLKEVEIPLAFDTEIVFATVPADDDALPVDGITIDLDPHVWGEILVEKPMRALADDAYEGDVEAPVETGDDDTRDSGHPLAGIARRN